MEWPGQLLWAWVLLLHHSVSFLDTAKFCIEVDSDSLNVSFEGARQCDRGKKQADCRLTSAQARMIVPLVVQETSSPHAAYYEPAVRWGSAAAQGQRQAMEDAHIGVLNLQQQTERRLGFEPSKAQAFFGVRCLPFAPGWSPCACSY